MKFQHHFAVYVLRQVNNFSEKWVSPKKHLKFPILYFHTRVSLSGVNPNIWLEVDCKIQTLLCGYLAPFFSQLSNGHNCSVWQLCSDCTKRDSGSSPAPRVPASALLGSSLLLAVLTEKPLIHPAERMKLSLTLRGAAAGSVETQAGVLGKFTPSGLLLGSTVCKYDFSILGYLCKSRAPFCESSDCSGALYHSGMAHGMLALSLLQKQKKREQFP